MTVTKITSKVNVKSSKIFIAVSTLFICSHKDTRVATIANLCLSDTIEEIIFIDSEIFPRFK